MDQQWIQAENNVLFSVFAIKKSDKTVVIREHSLADGNFLLSYYTKWILNGNGSLCLVNFHHTLTHYQSIGKRLGFDVLTNIKANNVEVIEPMKIVTDEILETGSTHDSLPIFEVKKLFITIKDALEKLQQNQKEIYLLMDDVSHLLDMGVSLKDIVTFLNCCFNLPVKLVLLTHVSDKIDSVIGNFLCYSSDVYFDILSLKTGFSRDVTGILKYNCRNFNNNNTKENTYHFKAMEKEVKIFFPGEAMHLFHK